MAKTHTDIDTAILAALDKVANASAKALVEATGIPLAKLRKRCSALAESGAINAAKQSGSWVYWKGDGDASPKPAKKASKKRASKKRSRKASMPQGCSSPSYPEAGSMTRVPCGKCDWCKAKAKREAERAAYESERKAQQREVYNALTDLAFITEPEGKDRTNPSKVFQRVNTYTGEREPAVADVTGKRSGHHYFEEGDLVWFASGRHLAGKWAVLVLEVSKGKRGSRFYALSEDGNLYTVTGEMAKRHIKVRDWSVVPKVHNPDNGEYGKQEPVLESDAVVELRKVWRERADLGYDKAMTVRNRISSRRAAGQLARAEGRRHWYWSEYGC